MEIPIEKLPNEAPPFITPLKTADYTAFTKITPIYSTKAKVRFEACPPEVVVPDVHDIIEECLIPRPPPLLALSQAIRRKHPEQLLETKLNDQLSSIKDLPVAPANYSFVFYGFHAT